MEVPTRKTTHPGPVPYFWPQEMWAVSSQNRPRTVRWDDDPQWLDTIFQGMAQPPLNYSTVNIHCFSIKTIKNFRLCGVTLFPAVQTVYYRCQLLQLVDGGAKFHWLWNHLSGTPAAWWESRGCEQGVAGVASLWHHCAHAGTASEDRNNGSWGKYM